MKDYAASRPTGAAEILVKARKLGWSANEIETLLFTYGPALHLDSAHQKNAVTQSEEMGGIG